MNISKSDFSSFVAFFLMPIYSFPLLLINIYRKSYFSIYLFPFFLGFCSFIYLPYSNDDRVRHYERFYEISKLGGVNQLFEYLSSNNLPDSLGYLLMYFVSIFSNDPRIVFFIATTIPAYLYTYIYLNLNKHVLGNLSNKMFFYSFILFLCSLPYLAWFSGLRFGFASGFVFLGWYLLNKNKSSLKGLSFLGLAVFTHFGTILVLIPLICTIYFTKLNAKRLLWLTLPFFIVPKELIYNLITMLPLPGVIIKKAFDYLMWEDMLVTMASSAPILKLILLYRALWVPLFLLYLLRRKNEVGLNSSYNFIMYLFIVRNLFSSSPVITGYYDAIILPISTMFLIQEYSKNRISKRILFFILVYFIGFWFIDIYKLRDGFIMSNIDIENVSFVSIFLKEIPNYIPEPWK
ncbi:EpsG family protein [Myroides marinus]|nr:EpsG family protein [Myroides marinus]